MYSLLWNGGLKLETDPFPHIVSHPALPPKIYDELARTRPTMEQIIAGRDIREGTPDVVPNCRVDLTAERLLNDDWVPASWWSFVVYHMSGLWWRDVARVFGETIQKTYPGLEAAFGRPLAMFTQSPRYGAKFGEHGCLAAPSDLMMEFTVGLNTPAVTEGRVRGPHLDNPRELVTALLYMPDGPEDEAAGGDLILYRWKDMAKRRFYGKYETYDELVEPVKIIPYSANTMVMFLNTPVSVHGVSPRKVCAKPRLLCAIATETKGPLFFQPDKPPVAV